jgi:nicotinamidase-related amidase
MQQTLLLIDIQNDYFPGGKMELVGSSAAGSKAQRLLRSFREKALPIVHIQHLSTRQGATFFVPDTVGVQFHECVTPAAQEMVFQKHYPNTFRETPLLEYLRSLSTTRLVIAGMMTHMCIDTSTRAAADLGFECVLTGDACATKNLSFGGVDVSAQNVQAAFLAALNGSFATVLTTEDVCRSL